MKNRYVISIGSNTPGKELCIEKALSYLSQEVDIDKVSSTYVTQSISGGDVMYANCVAVCSTRYNEPTFNSALKQIEVAMGRTPDSRKLGIVPIDLDIVISNGRVVRARDFGYEYFQRGWRELSCDDLQC